MARSTWKRRTTAAIVLVGALLSAAVGRPAPVAATPADLGPFASADVLVKRQFSDFLGRIPFAGELNGLVGQLTAGTVDAPTVISQIADIEGGADRTGSVTRLYLAYFLRNPDASGLQYWVGKARNGTTLQRISSSFAGSSEFTKRYGALSNAAFVALVYQNVLGRPGDAAGTSYWTKQLDLRRKDRGQVMLGFSESSEYARKTADVVDVVVVHAAMLQRIPTGSAWTDALALVAAEGRLALIRQVFGSSAYGARFPVPAAPTGVAVDVEDARLLVRWTSPPAGSLPLTGFEVRATPASGPAVAVEPPVGATSATVFGLTNGTAYTVTVRARNANGLGGPASAGPFTPTVASRWTTYQGSSIHDGNQVVDPPSATPTKQWSASFPDGVSYPVVARGRAFVTVRSSSSGHYGGRLYALDVDTGAVLWGPKDVGGVYYKQGIAWDRGLVYVVNADGLVRAYREVDGAVVWSRQLAGEYLIGSPPTARDGVVYVAGGTTQRITALDGATGAVRWSQHSGSGQQTPIVTSSAAYTNAGCSARAYSLTGTLLWSTPDPCESIDGAASTLAAGRLFVRSAWGNEQGLVSTTGTNVAGTYPSVVVPAFSGGTGVGVTDSTVTAFDATTLATRWSATFPVGTVALAPVIADGRAYVVGSRGDVVAYDLATGRVAWTADAGTSVDSVDEGSYAGPLTGAAIAEGLLLVPVGSTLVAFG